MCTEKVTGVNLNDLCHLYQVRATEKSQFILVNLGHPLHIVFKLHQDGGLVFLHAIKIGPL